jgi:predicted enzyme related to lactoylglutathione lyase
MDDQGMPQMVEGAIVHIELFSEDVNASEAFYTTLFGWTTKRWGDTSNYLLFMDSSGKLGGGFAPMKNQGAGGTIVYLYVGDIEAKLSQVETHGGRTLEGKTPIPGVGFYATFADPFGNHIGLFSNS